MAIATYTLAEYIQDLRTVTSETQDPNEIIARVGPLAERAALSRDWLKPHHYECDPEQGFGVHLLHEEADHTLAVFAIAWLPHGSARSRRQSLGSGLPEGDLQSGWYRPVHCKALPAQEIRALLTGRRLLLGKLRDVELGIRGLLRGFGLKVGAVSKGRSLLPGFGVVA